MQALRASELSCRRLFKAAQDGLLILDGDPGAVKIVTAVRREAARLKARALQNTTLNRASFSIIAIDLAPLNPATPPALLKATKPKKTTKGVPKCAVKQCKQCYKESHAKTNEHTINTIEIPGHRAGQ